MSLVINALLPNLQFKVSKSLFASSRELDNSDINEIKKIWENEKKKRSGRLENKSVLCIESMEDNICWIQKTDYMNFVAQLNSKTLKKKLAMRILAVSGLLIFKNQILFGLRSPHVTQDPNAWELVPSGSLSHPEPVKQFLLEANEELGIKNKSLSDITPFAMIEDVENGVVDIGIEARLSYWDKDAKRTDEYSEVKAIEMSHLPEFLKPRKLVEVSEILLKFRKYI